MAETETNSNRVVSLAEMARRMTTVGETDATMPLRVVTELKESGDVHSESSVTGRLPRRKANQFALEGVEQKPVAAVVPLHQRPVEERTGTHALPVVEKMTGKPSEAIDLHRTAARVQQAMGPYGYAVWFGEHTKEFWVMDSNGLHSFADVTSMYQGMGWQDL